MSDIADELRAFEGSEALGNGDFGACYRGAAEITRLRAALATARREGMEEAAQKALIIASALSSPSAQNALRSFADAISAAAKEEQ